MSLQRLTIDGYASLELNNVTFPRTGASESQCALNATDFATIPAENGMILAVDNISRTVKLPSADADLPLALVYSSEHMYDERTPGLKNFKNSLGSFYPRLGYLTLGDKFTTNCIAYDTEDFADDTAVKAAIAALGTTKLYGKPCANGAIQLTDTKPTTAVKLLAVKNTTVPNCTLGVKFQVIA